MCSIFGFSSSGKGLEKPFFELMKHRGPDAEATFSIDGWTLGHQRLSIIDTSHNADQPMLKNGNCIVFNGEIYNYRELRDEYLRDAPFDTTSDTEVLLELLNRYGTGIINKLNGMFAFAWYNVSERRLVLCRDRYGVKPLHWCRTRGIFYFSSEIKPLVAVKGGISLNRHVVDAFIADTASDFDDRTFAEGIYQIRPGCLLSIDTEGRHESTQWYRGEDFSFDKSMFESYHDTIAAFEDLLVDSIKLRHRADVPICITLSGGLDSTTIYTLAKERIGSAIKPFTFSHRDSSTDESDLVFHLARDYGDIVCTVHSNHHQGAQDIQEALRFLEFPTWNPSAIAYLDMYKAIAASGFKVVIEGHGSDEQLGGYPYMIDAAFKESLAGGDISLAWKIFGVYLDTINPSLDRNISRPKPKAWRFLTNAIQSMKSAGMHTKSFQDVLDEAFHYRILPIVLRTFDRLTMSQSIESRSPFMDYRVVEFIRALPLQYKTNNIGSKALLREILKKYRKDVIYKRRIKMGFASDLPALLNNDANRAFFRDKIAAFAFEGHEKLKASALERIGRKSIAWSDVEPIWKTASLQIVRELYATH